APVSADPYITPSHLCSALFLSKYPAPKDTYPLSLHDALPISGEDGRGRAFLLVREVSGTQTLRRFLNSPLAASTAERRRLARVRSEEHTSELQSLTNLVCRLLLEQKKKIPARLKTA